MARSQKLSGPLDWINEFDVDEKSDEDSEGQKSKDRVCLSNMYEFQSNKSGVASKKEHDDDLEMSTKKRQKFSSPHSGDSISAKDDKEETFEVGYAFRDVLEDLIQDDDNEEKEKEETNNIDVRATPIPEDERDDECDGPSSGNQIESDQNLSKSACKSSKLENTANSNTCIQSPDGNSVSSENEMQNREGNEHTMKVCDTGEGKSCGPNAELSENLDVNSKTAVEDHNSPDQSDDDRGNEYRETAKATTLPTDVLQSDNTPRATKSAIDNAVKVNPKPMQIAERGDLLEESKNAKKDVMLPMNKDTTASQITSKCDKVAVAGIHSIPGDHNQQQQTQQMVPNFSDMPVNMEMESKKNVNFDKSLKGKLEAKNAKNVPVLYEGTHTLEQIAAYELHLSDIKSNSKRIDNRVNHMIRLMEHVEKLIESATTTDCTTSKWHAKLIEGSSTRLSLLSPLHNLQRRYSLHAYILKEQRLEGKLDQVNELLASMKGIE